MDAITVIKEDHRTVNTLFKKFEGLSSRASKSKRQTVDKIIELLSVHAAIEEEILYPVIREQIPQTEDDILEAYEEHLIVKWTLAALEHMDVTDERFDAKVTVLIETVRHHVKEEEGDILPKLRQAMRRSELQELGTEMVKAKKTAPRRPHPRIPDSPVIEAVAGPVAAVVDRARDVGRDAVERVRERVS